MLGESILLLALVALAANGQGLPPLPNFAVEPQLLAYDENLGDRILSTWPFLNGNPTTMEEALELGWEQVGEDCDPHYGYRMRTPERFDLLFDNTGHIAGLSYVTQNSDFPPRSEDVRTNIVEPFWQIGETESSLTFFFMDPKKLCTATEDDHVPGSIGNRLWHKRGYDNDKLDFLNIPLTRNRAALANDGWNMGTCNDAHFWNAITGQELPPMGTHYWSHTEDCEDSGQFFILYCKDRLCGIGFNFVGVNVPAPPSVLSSFYKPWEMPDAAAPYLTMLHDRSPCVSNINTVVEGQDLITVVNIHTYFYDYASDATCELDVPGPYRDPAERAAAEEIAQGKEQIRNILEGPFECQTDADCFGVGYCSTNKGTCRPFKGLGQYCNSIQRCDCDFTCSEDHLCVHSHEM